MKKYQIEIGEDELRLVQKALDFYGRISLGQFKEISDVPSVDKLLDKKDRHEDFNRAINEMAFIYNQSLHSYYGIFNKENVGDDARIVMDIEHAIRHKFWQDQPIETRTNYTVNSHPADICRIAGMATPVFKIINDEYDGEDTRL